MFGLLVGVAVIDRDQRMQLMEVMNGSERGSDSVTHAGNGEP
jgi:hypothetical protein